MRIYRLKLQNFSIYHWVILREDNEKHKRNNTLQKSNEQIDFNKQNLVYLSLKSTCNVCKVYSIVYINHFPASMENWHVDRNRQIKKVTNIFKLSQMLKITLLLPNYTFIFRNTIKSTECWFVLNSVSDIRC